MLTQVFVDLSNVCRDESLGFSSERASWQRWTKLRTLVQKRLGDDAAFHLVADGNLRKMLSRSEQVAFDQARQAGTLESSDEADLVLLQGALDVGGVVVSNDNFTDYMKLDGIRNLRIIRWGMRAGAIMFSEAPLVPPHSVLITERQEREELKRHWAKSADLQHRWSCPDAHCREDYILVPNFRHGDPLCPSCESFLVESGEWRDAAMVKVLVDGEVVERRILEDGDSIGIGLLPADKSHLDLSGQLGADLLERVGAEHLEVRNVEGRLIVADLVSSTGSVVLVPSDSRLKKRTWQPGRTIQPGRAVELKRGMRVRLGQTTVVVERSGRSFGRGRG